MDQSQAVQSIKQSVQCRFLLYLKNMLESFLIKLVPSFPTLRKVFAAYLKLDITTIAAGLTIFGTIGSSLGELKVICTKFQWWFIEYCTTAITIDNNDDLAEEVMKWVSENVLKQKGRVMTARTKVSENYWVFERKHADNDDSDETVHPVEYLASYGNTYFIHNRNIFLVSRLPKDETPTTVPVQYCRAAKLHYHDVLVMCLGRSIEPIKRFLKTCRQFEANKQESFTRIQLFKNNQWHFSILRPIRKLGTVYFDEDVKADMLADVEKYLEPSTRKFYSDCGIPYRRGYLLHGPPGTGKTSLSLALAGHLRVNIYLVHLPSVETDSDLQNLFGQLPPKCIVLLEDIDATGVTQERKFDLGLRFSEEEKREKDEENKHSPGGIKGKECENTKNKSETISKVSSCTLSGLLNVLDGPSSQEGRIVLMTSNIAEKLDPALTRPGRIDKKIFLGLMSQKSAERMFLGMYKPAAEALNLVEATRDMKSGHLQKYAARFASAIPDRKFTPAQLQEYLLMRKESPALAAEGIADWVKENLRKHDETKANSGRGEANKSEESGDNAAQKEAQSGIGKEAPSSANGDSSTSSTGTNTPSGSSTKNESFSKKKDNTNVADSKRVAAS